MANSDGVQENVDNLKKDISKLRSDLSGVTNALINVSKNAYATKNQELQAEAQKLIEEFGSTMDTARSKGRDKVHAAENKIGEKPFMSVLIAFLIGLVLGTIYDRK